MDNEKKELYDNLLDIMCETGELGFIIFRDISKLRDDVVNIILCDEIVTSQIKKEKLRNIILQFKQIIEAFKKEI